MSHHPTPSAEAWPWPDSLDALVAAPAYHQRLLENDRVRVIHTLIPAGATVPVHTHRWPGVAYVVSSSEFVRRDQDGNVLLDSRNKSSSSAAPATQWLEPLPPHTVENVGSAQISIIVVELKEPAHQQIDSTANGSRLSPSLR
jgi:hypothetical protein